MCGAFTGALNAPTAVFPCNYVVTRCNPPRPRPHPLPEHTRTAHPHHPLLWRQLLLLWDRILGYDSLELLPLLAVAILLFRSDTILETSDGDAVRSQLEDLSKIKVTVLLQYVLFSDVPAET